MFTKADLTQEEVEAPYDHTCASGHKAPFLFRRGGPGSLEEPTRFFLVLSQGVQGIYCEPCLIIAHWAAQQQKQSKR